MTDTPKPSHRKSHVALLVDTIALQGPITRADLYRTEPLASFLSQKAIQDLVWRQVNNGRLLEGTDRSLTVNPDWVKARPYDHIKARSAKVPSNADTSAPLDPILSEIATLSGPVPDASRHAARLRALAALLSDLPLTGVWLNDLAALITSPSLSQR